MTSPVLRVGTRGSALALAQSDQVAQAVIAAVGEGRVELVRIRTEGDINRGALATIGGTGVFVTAVREALLSGRVDLVVHSFKDLPTTPADGVTLSAVPARGDPADALCARDGLTLAGLPPAATVGTGSPRREAQILSLRSDLRVVAVRGNVGTRLAGVRKGELDAVMLAAAGLRRLGLGGAITELFDPLRFLPAPAQGALAVESRAGESPWFAAGLAELDDPAGRWAAIAERAVLAGLEAGCSAPVSALGRFAEEDRWVGQDPAASQIDGSAPMKTPTQPPTLTLTAQVTAANGSRCLRREGVGTVTDDGSAFAIGERIAGELLDAGAATLMRAS